MLMKYLSNWMAKMWYEIINIQFMYRVFRPNSLSISQVFSLIISKYLLSRNSNERPKELFSLDLEIHN